MKYNNIKKGRFISRPNRFIAEVEIDDTIEICHVKNTGRCKELLVTNAEVFLEKSINSNRKTKYDLVAVYKETEYGKILINMDSLAPNKMFLEYLQQGLFEYFPINKNSIIKPEARYGNSRFDFYVKTGDREAFIEVKGVTLEVNGVALFPDAPTERGVKHISELCRCKTDGYETFVIFIIQFENVNYFTPNCEMHPEFSDILEAAYKKGVKILSYNSIINYDEILIKQRKMVNFSSF